MPACQHIISVHDISPDQIEELFTSARAFRIMSRSVAALYHRNRSLVTCFEEPSTRTRLSFESAMYRLGGRVLSVENARDNTSMAKGESIEDSIRMLGNVADLIVFRHRKNGAAHRARSVSRVPIINAGDGWNEHPTQALTDVFTIREHHGHIDGLTVVLVGDLLYSRSVHSLVRLLSGFSVRIIGVCPEPLRLPPDIEQLLQESSSELVYEHDYAHAITQADVLVMGRLQHERHATNQSLEKELDALHLRPALIRYFAQNNMIILHPLPRRKELPIGIDDFAQAAYFRSAENAPFVRMALIDLCLSSRST